LKITFLGHAGFFIEGSEKIAIDPFLTGNPLAKNKPEEIDADLVLVSHGHSDHLGDAIQIAKEAGATIISVFELASFCSRNGAQAHGMHIGGSRTFGKAK